MVQNGDVIRLGTILESNSRTQPEKHLPTELELGIVVMPQTTSAPPQPSQPIVIPSANSFHAPLDTDSESEEEHEQSLPKLVLRPFASQSATEFQGETSSAVTSVDGGSGGVVIAGAQVAPSQPAQVPIVDLTQEEAPYVAVEPVHVECISLISEDEPEDQEIEEQQEEEEEGEEYTGPADYAFPYEYDSEDKESVNGDLQVPETQIFTTVQNPPILVSLPTLVLK